MSNTMGTGQPNGPRNPRAEVKAAKAYAKASRPWYRKKRWWVLAVAVIFVAVAATTGGGTDEPSVTSDDKKTTTTAQPTKPAEAAADEPRESEPEMTSGQENALAAAENYLEIAPFSRKGLIRQLSSDAGDGYSRKDATYAADHVDVDWKEQAVKAAENYLDISPFSRQAMIEQLSSDAGDGYTRAQAEHGAEKAGL
ncbi:Ltp family lipoprotein [Aeromicrobium sp. IC_218]|uniref:Ltp family lipoprotein n=1 Tax=Aeromicrobium sp. IC_218 TaxID=2545468 RepID=UPI001A954763|nr:Ltp family lipoprotein [Aeromicrobium sp. IC_218]